MFRSAIAIAATLSAGPALAASFTLIDLGDLPSATTTTVTDINDSG